MSQIHKAQWMRVSKDSASEYMGMMGRLGYRCFEISSLGELGREMACNEEFELANVAFMN